jgi:hypothetical protein
MKQVWKCDHCSHTNVDKDEVKLHENECCFNEVNKRCETCDNHVWEGYGSDGWYVCDIDETFDVDDNVDGGCLYWVNEEWSKRREKKLERIVNGKV